MRPKKGSYDADFVKGFLMNDGNEGKNNTPTEVLMLPAGKPHIKMPKLNASSIVKESIYSFKDLDELSRALNENRTYCFSTEASTFGWCATCKVS